MIHDNSHSNMEIDLVRSNQITPDDHDAQMAIDSVICLQIIHISSTYHQTNDKHMNINDFFAEL